MAGTASSLGIQHVFVLMLENRSFDHMLGYSRISGIDADTRQPTSIAGLAGTENNTFEGQTYTVSAGADTTMPTDPVHEFGNVLEQLCGPAAVYAKGGLYPPIDNSGYVASYMKSGGQSGAEVMKSYRPDQLPVLNALASEFVVCDNWHASMPGPTWPNRMFVHAASSGGLDHSPTTLEIAEWETIDGFHFPNGTIFDCLHLNGITRCIYGGDDFPMISALKGIQLDDVRHYSLFASDLAQDNYPYTYIFIEPSYDVLNDYRNGASQHPLADVTRGEALIKSTYEAIRNSPLWANSLLIVTWDEHGGFFDHVMPPPARSPGDTDPGAQYNTFGFTFERYGPRVPALVISPRIPKNLIDHRLYDHASIPATLESLFGLSPLTLRDAAANRLDVLCTLGTAREDTPQILPSPATPGTLATIPQGGSSSVDAASVSRPADEVDRGNLPSLVHAALRQDLALQRQATVNRVAAMQNREQARAYIAEVQQKVRQMPQKT